MFRQTVVFLLLGAGSLVSGCTCGGPSPAARDVLTSYCNFIDRCPDQLQYSLAYRSTAECVDILAFVTTCRVDQVAGPTGDRVPTLVKTMLNVEPSQAAACQAYLASADCKAALTGCDPATDAGCNPCSTLFAPSVTDTGSGTRPGTVALDQKCDEVLLCAPGLYCIPPKSTSDAGISCRVCKPLRPIGGDCIDPPYVPCASGSFCESAAGVCVALSASGLACQNAFTCSSSFCNPNTKVCDSGGHTGEACTAASDCRTDACVGGHCTARLANGGACASAEQCLGGVCDPGSGKCGKPSGATCSSGGECQGWCDAQVCKPGVQVGSTCSLSEQCESKFCHSKTRVCAAPCSAGCHDGSYCDSYGACLPALADGSHCEAAEQCTSGFCTSTGSCATKPGLGQSCQVYTDCFPKGFCSGGSCQAFKKPGEACTGFDSCAAPFLCKSGICTLMSLACEPAAIGAQCAWLQVCDSAGYCDPLNQLTCAAKKGAGASCFRSVECSSGLYCNNLTCVAAAAAGAECGGRTVCADGLFCDKNVSPNLCSAPKPAGAQCRAGSDCQSGDCAFSGGTGLVCQAACTSVAPGDQPACHPVKCADRGFTCGSIDTGCGETVSCGTCKNFYETCGGAGQPQQCGCTPKRACPDRACSTAIDDGCGHQLACNATCTNGSTCGAVTPETCGCPSDRVAGPSISSQGATVMIPEMGGGFAPWGQLDLVAAEDGSGAHVHIDSPKGTSGSSQYLVASGFGFNLPPTAVVNGISAQVRRYASGQVSDAEVATFSGGKRLGRLSGPSWESVWSTVTFGGDRALWGYPLTAAQVNAADFGIGLSVTAVGPSDAYVDDVRVTVSYAYRCDCSYACKPDSECGSDGCGGSCGKGCGDGGVCASGYCQPLVFVDQATGLMWQNTQFDESNCDAFTLGGFTDWRVPTIDELRTRVIGCPATAPGGACKVSSGCTLASCLEASCDGCGDRQGPGPYGCYLDNHTEWIACTGGYQFFSSTKNGTTPYAIDFGSGKIAPGTTQVRYRCVRP